MKMSHVDTNWFNQIISNEFKKEDPSKQHYYKEILKEENVQLYNVYVFGDSVESDLIPALRLGMNAFYVDNANNIPKLVTNIIDNKI